MDINTQQLNERINNFISTFNELNEQIIHVNSALICERSYKKELHLRLEDLKKMDNKTLLIFSNEKFKKQLQREITYNINKTYNAIRKCIKIIQEYLELIENYNKIKRIIAIDGIFECQICCDFKTKIVTGMCGHILCIDCYNQLRTQSCPVCKHNYNGKIIKLYL